MNKFLLTLMSALLSIYVNGQEICDNGLDDDGDGLIDMNDADCQCFGISSGEVFTSSKIPNPSFENRLCCPDDYSQMNCTEFWMQAATEGTSDYFNTCGFTHVEIFAPPPLPLPDGGNGYVGFYDQHGYKEYIGVCLNSPLYIGTNIEFSFYLARARLGLETSYVIHVYGTPDCTDLPWNGMSCPVGTGSWVFLGADTVRFPPMTDLPDTMWQKGVIQFYSPMDIYGIAIGPPCEGQQSDFPSRYMYLDALQLDSFVLSDFNINIQELGKWCTNNLELEASINTSGGIWQWYRDGIALAGETSASLDLMTYGVASLYTAVYFLDGECASIDHLVDTTDPANLPRALNILNKDTIVCEGAIIPIVASATSGYNYQWLPTAGVSDPHSLTPDITVVRNSVSYSLTANYPGCPDTSQSIFIEVDSQYVVSFEAEPKEVCAGMPIYLYPNIDGTVSDLVWRFPDHDRSEMTKSAFQHAFEEEGVYPITLYSQFRACPDTSYTDSITVYPFPEVDLGVESSICLDGAPVYLKNFRPIPKIAHRYFWNTGDTTATIKVVHPGIFTLSVTAEPIGCTTTESIEISKDCYIDVPNAFTPNGDGYNDYFFPRQLLSESVSRFKLQVFNRWGQIIFETTNLDGRGWDGRFNDKDQPIGVYLYRIQVDFTSGRQESHDGNVTLLR